MTVCLIILWFGRIMVQDHQSSCCRVKYFYKFENMQTDGNHLMSGD